MISGPLMDFYFLRTYLLFDESILLGYSWIINI